MNPILFGTVFGAIMIYILICSFTYKDFNNYKKNKEKEMNKQEKEKEEIYKKNIDDIFLKYTVDGVLTPNLEMCKELAKNDFLYHPEKLGIEPCDISTMTSNMDEYNRIIDTYAMGLAKGMLLAIEGMEEKKIWVHPYDMVESYCSSSEGVEEKSSTPNIEPPIF